MRKIVIIGTGLIGRDLFFELVKLGYDVNIVSATRMGIGASQAEDEKPPEVDWTECKAADLVILAMAPGYVEFVVGELDGYVKLLDLSNKTRGKSGWGYGSDLVNSDRLLSTCMNVSNPGCFATASLMLLQPLTDQGVINTEQHIYLDAMSGYSAGGDYMVQQTQNPTSNPHVAIPMMSHWGHPHIPEIKRATGLTNVVLVPKIVPSLYSGMVVQTFLDDVDSKDIETAYKAFYKDRADVAIITMYSGPINVNYKSGKEGGTIFINRMKSGVLVTCAIDNLIAGGMTNILRNVRIMLEV